MNYLSKDGAQDLAWQIKDYWEKRGYVVRVYPYSIGHFSDSPYEQWAVASDLVGGLPR